MANLAADAVRPSKRASAPWSYQMVGYTNMQGGSVAYTIYKGAIVMMDVSDVDGYVQPRQSGTNAATGDIFAGIAIEQVSVTSADAADGAKSVHVWRKGIFGFPVGSIAKTDIGALAYASDDGNVTTTSTNNLKVGYIVDVDATYVWVEIDLMAGQVAA